MKKPRARKSILARGYFVLGVCAVGLGSLRPVPCAVGLASLGLPYSSRLASSFSWCWQSPSAVWASVRSIA